MTTPKIELYRLLKYKYYINTTAINFVASISVILYPYTPIEGGNRDQVNGI